MEAQEKNPLSCAIRVPADCSRAELERFQELVEEGGEVAIEGLRQRICRATVLAFRVDGQDIVGVAGLKCPTRTYRAKLIENSGAQLDARRFPHELGWVYVCPAARGRRGTPLLVNNLLEFVRGRGV